MLIAYLLVSTDVMTYSLPAQRPTLGQMARVLAYANVPRALLLLIALPVFGGWPFLAGWLAGAVLVLTVVTYAQALDALLDLDVRTSAAIALIVNLPATLSYLMVWSASY